MRPQFLTLLCILTFLSCGLGIIDSVVSLTNMKEVTQTKRVDRKYKAEDQKTAPTEYFEDRASGDAPMPADPNEIQPLAVAGLIYSLLCLAGALLMFRLRRVGYYVYLAGVAAGLILPDVPFWRFTSA